MTDLATRVDQLNEMPHLKSTLEEVKAATEAKTSKDITPEETEDPRTKPSYTFEFRYVDGRKRVWTGTFTNKILSIKDRQLVGNLQAQFTAGFSYDSQDPLTREINLMISHMAVSLKGHDVKWAGDLQSINSLPLLQALFKEVMAHEATFHGLGEVEEASEEKRAGGADSAS